MNKFITTAFGGLPLKNNDLRWSDDAYRTAFTALCKAIALTSQVEENFILWGCELKSDGIPDKSGYKITEGAVFIDGEICEFTETTIAPEFTLFFVKDTTTYNPAGLKLFKNGTTHNTYNIRKCIVIESEDTPSEPYLMVNNAKNLTQIIEKITDARFITIENRATTVEGKVSAIEAAWTTLPLNEAIFNTGWSVSSASIKYKIIGKTMHMSINIESSVGNPTAQNYLTIKIPQSKLTPNGVGFFSICQAAFYDPFQWMDEHIQVVAFNDLVKFFVTHHHSAYRLYATITFEIQ